MFRSLLFIPGNNPSMIQNADIFLADGIIFDLEDSVDIDEKDNARNLVRNLEKLGKFQIEQLSRESWTHLKIHAPDNLFKIFKERQIKSFIQIH